MIKANVCYLHKQDSNKWQWFLADDYGRALVRCNETFNTHEEAEKDYEHNHMEIESRLDFSGGNVVSK